MRDYWPSGATWAALFAFGGRLMKQYNVKVVSVKLIKEASVPYMANHIGGPDDAFDFFRGFLEDADREQFMAMYLNTKNRPNAISTISIGTLSTSSVHPREVFKAAILSNSAAIILAHNHPSGDPTPSREDLDVTKRLMQAGEIVGIQILDHVIVGHGGSFVSMKASEMI